MSEESPRCPDHIGKREFQGETIEYHGATAFLSAATSRSSTGCERSAKLTLVTQGSTRRLPLPSAMSDFALVDFSPDGSSILLHGTITRSFPDEALRYIQIGLLEVSSGEIQWHDVWDLFQWKDCDALVEPQGFTRDGKVAVVARESVFSAPRRANCVSGGPPHQGPGPSARGLYVLDVKSKSAGAAPVEVQVERYGKVVRPAVQACQSDPDIVDACFKVRARLRAYNGAPTLRIWEVGTKRVFGVSSRDSVIPESLALAGGASYFDFEAFADFLLCPFSRPQPGEMQLVCVQSATGVKIKRQ